MIWRFRDILTEVYKYLHIKDLKNVRLISTFQNNIFVTEKWYNIIISFKFHTKPENIKNFIKIKDESVKMLGNCHALYLIRCYKITDESVKMLGKCAVLYLSFCNKITDESVKMLYNCRTLDLSWCKEITDESVKVLVNCH